MVTVILVATTALVLLLQWLPTLFNIARSHTPWDKGKLVGVLNHSDCANESQNDCASLLNSKCINWSTHGMCQLHRLTRHSVSQCFTNISHSTGRKTVILFIGDSRFGQMFNELKFVFTRVYTDRLYRKVQGNTYKTNDGIQINFVKVGYVKKCVDILDKLITDCTKSSNACPYMVVMDVFYLYRLFFHKKQGPYTLDMYKQDLILYIRKLEEFRSISGAKIVVKASDPLIPDLTSIGNKEELKDIEMKMQAYVNLSADIFSESENINYWDSYLELVVIFVEELQRGEIVAGSRRELVLPDGAQVHRPPAVMYREITILLNYVCSQYKEESLTLLSHEDFYTYVSPSRISY